ncbi:hypothetical protein GALMADRAFT_1270415 [Galerina marginata CBS 339.88]|uniref:Uncharacterized protein n=1 Tax=Galerina marginata (strain CBS 339.88) TaxID=685588 RepID=A0A067T6H3_GALM3|nr:hypothetical protein GALMADRAFT_1270415 [Galerina marginata CBS 339.88]
MHILNDQTIVELGRSDRPPLHWAWPMLCMLATSGASSTANKITFRKRQRRDNNCPSSIDNYHHTASLHFALLHPTASNF